MSLLKSVITYSIWNDIIINFILNLFKILNIIQTIHQILIAIIYQVLHQLLISGLGQVVWVKNLETHDPTHISWVVNFSIQSNSSTQPNPTRISGWVGLKLVGWWIDLTQCLPILFRSNLVNNNLIQQIEFNNKNNMIINKQFFRKQEKSRQVS